MDKLRALNTFVAVAELRSFAKAARKLNVSAPSVTRLVGELEEELGINLLSRTTRQVTVTEIGHRYLEDAKAVLSDLQLADEAAQGAHGTPKGEIRVTASSMFGNLYVTPIITKYLELYPETIVNGLFVDRIVNIIDEGIDVSIRIGDLQDTNLIATRVGSVKLKICGSPEYFKSNSMPEKPKDLLGHNTIGLTLGNFQSGWNFSNGEIIKPDHRLIFNSIPAAISAAKSGWGLARVISYQIGPHLENGSLESVLELFEPEPIPIYVIHNQGRKVSAKIRAFIDITVDTLRTNPIFKS